MICSNLNIKNNILYFGGRSTVELAEKYGFSPNKHASRLSMKPINIGIILSSRFDVNTQKMTEGIKKAHSRLKDYKINYDISVIDKRKNTDKDYVDALEKYGNYDGIIVTGMSSPKCSEVLNCFYEKNKNIVQVQAVNENTKCLFSIYIDKKAFPWYHMQDEGVVSAQKRNKSTS